MSTNTSERSATDLLCCAPLSSAALSVDEATEVATIFAALADPVRLRLFSMVAAQGESCSCTLEGPLERSQPTISHHTKILAEAGLLIGERRGKWMWWHVNEERMSAVRRLLATSPR